MKTPEITIKELKEVRIIYIRFKGSYANFRKNSKNMFNQLLQFATKHNLIIPNVTKVLTIYNDNPFITQETNLRTSVAMTIPNDVNIPDDDEICISSISGRFAIGHFELSLKEYGEAWNYMYHEWLFKNKIKARDAIPFELYVTTPPKDFKNKSFTDIYIPIE